ncbi:uncharacterized protein GIQ15_03854 [Arthroderma uncinatum]|uniref:uncharacterized protein n=1 Tax=Arthroderma uncinatum TaxID=74035 RepID=UPI00144AA0BC|nr:uncharacterized protein GIQ15_03854 [Arthroderma uncinatum]KAF3481095.1 hypothetical protein GIQ15_03854 [Arthroderma uncinatum]
MRQPDTAAANGRTRGHLGAARKGMGLGGRLSVFNFDFIFNFTSSLTSHPLTHPSSTPPPQRSQRSKRCPNTQREQIRVYDDDIDGALRPVTDGLAVFTMAAMGELPLPSSALSPLTNQTQSYDPDMDSFLNLDQTMYPSPSVSPSNSDMKSSAKHNFIHHQQQQQQQVSTLPPAISSPQQEQYRGPSHQYSSYTQQTGLPPGGLASTIAINNNNNVNFGLENMGMVHPMDGIYGRIGQPLHSLPALPMKDSTEMDLDDSMADSQTYLMPSQATKTHVSSQDDGEQSNGLPQPAKYRKDEQDMDEDERLLASEEGKKLSSKERRQLRNKVSARAFRSRRKEYIGQLEGEVAAKTNEANELRLRNNALTEENARLSNFTRMLLSSPHFTPLLNELTANGIPPNLGGQGQGAVPQLPSQPTVTKEEGIEQLPQEISLPNLQTGLPVVPEQGFDFSSIDVGDQGWNSGIDFNFANPSVFPVLDVPTGPSLDMEAITGKSSNFVGPLPSDESKDVIPSIDAVPFGVEKVETSKESSSISTADLDIDETDPSFALFIDQPTTVSKPSSDNLFRGVQLDNISAKFDLVVEGSTTDSTSKEVSPAARRDFERLCASIEAPFHHISQLTAHLE